MSSEFLPALETAMVRKVLALPSSIRPFTTQERMLPRACLVTGSRGVGKTTFLLHHAQGRRLLYFSADNPRLSGLPLYSVAEAAFLQGYEGVIVDEVHFAQDWSRHLKALYDDFPDRLLWVSDSSSLVLRAGTGDLSRRFVPIRVPLLSFREFIALKTGTLHPVFSPFDTVPMAGSAAILDLFRLYRQEGTRPFFSEGNFAERLVGILEKTLYSDAPFFLPQLTDGNLRLMNAVVGTLARAPISRLQVRSLCADWSIGAEKLYQLLFVMESVGVLRTIRKHRDTKANTVGEKLFFGDPALYAALGGNPGTAREALAAAMLAEGGRNVEASGDESLGDFVIDGSILLEVGGTGKRPKKADFVIRDDADVATAKSLPLWSLGFLY